MSHARRKTLIRYIVPTVMSGVCFFLFTIIDGIFVGRGVGTNALGAVNLVMPFVMGVNALYMLTTIGGVTIVAIRLGRGDQAGANQAFMHALVLHAGIAVLLCAAGVLFYDPLCTLMGATGVFHRMAAEYLFWYALFIIPASFSVLLQGFCRNDGSPVLVSVAVLVSTACNVFGDWLLIFPLDMGLKGAAIATGVSQSIGLVIVLSHFLRRRGSLRFCRVRMKAALLGKLVIRGLPESIAQLATPVTTLCMNLVLMRSLGELGVNAFSLISYVASFSLAIFFGTSEGLQPLFGRSYGAKNGDDLKYCFRMGLLINFIGSVAINLLLLLAGGQVCALFGVDGETLRFTVRAMPQFAWGFILMSFNVMISAYLYSTKRSKQAILLNVLRSFLVNALVILILPTVFGSGLVWVTFGIYEALVLAIAVLLLKCSERGGLAYR